MSISFSHLSHRYDSAQVLQNVSLEVEDGEILAILGPSGSGKSTLLRLAAGLESVRDGTIEINGAVIADKANQTPPEDRATAIVFQDHVLFPHLTVAENTAFGMARNSSRTISELLENVGVADLADRYPDTLSGGQQQRVAIARALATEPDVLLLDEPFANVDIALRRKLREDARRTLKHSKVATLLVTHDPVEAMVLGDRIACLVDGKIVQIGDAETLYRDPAHQFVAEAVSGGQMINGSASEGKAMTNFGTINIPSELAAREIVICILPGGVSIERSRTDCKAQVADVRFTAGEHIIIVTSGQEQLYVTSSVAPEVSIGETVNLGFTPALVRVYPK